MTYISNNTLIKPLFFPVKIITTIKQQLSCLDWAMFLESTSAIHVDSNWSIFTAQPIATLTEVNKQVLFSDLVNNTEQLMGSDPLAAQMNIRQHLFSEDKPAEYPFTGGAVVAYHYEMGELFESLHKQQPNTGLNLGTYHCGFYDWAILFNLKDNQYFLVQQRTRDQKQDLSSLWDKRFEWLLKLSKQHDNNQDDKNQDNFKLINEWQANYTEAEYHQSFDKIQQYILSGDCYQVNLAQRFQADYRGDEYQAYQALLVENKAPFAAFIRLPTHIILSVSPERFLSLTGEQIQTKPIKGTMPRHADPVQDLANKQHLLHSEKDQAENLMIVDLLRNDIGRVCKPGSVSVPSLFNIESFPAVHHLVSTVTGQLDAQYTCEDLLRACFPGGSITGAPKIRSMEIICELEKFQREIYCGSIAYINGNGDMDSSITIRTLVCQDNRIYCWAGGGIVADSNAQSEYKECFDKVSKILPVLTELNQTK